MPCNAGNGRHGTELMDDVARNKVDVVVSQFQVSILNAFTS